MLYVSRRVGEAVTTSNAVEVETVRPAFTFLHDAMAALEPQQGP